MEKPTKRGNPGKTLTSTLTAGHITIRFNKFMENVGASLIHIGVKSMIE